MSKLNLELVKPGDFVAIMDTHHGDAMMCKVSRVTKTQIIFDFTRISPPTKYERRFSKRDGRELGSGRRWYWASLATVDEGKTHNEARDARIKHTCLVAAIKGFNYGDVHFSTLEAIATLLELEVPK